MGLDFQSLSKNPERQSIRSEKLKRKIKASKDRKSALTENEQSITYCESAYQELTLLLSEIEDPSDFEFYGQISEIWEKFKSCQMEHIVNYFNVLVNVLSKKKMQRESVHLPQIIKIRDELQKWILAERKAAATKIEMTNLSGIKPVASRQSENSIEDGLDLDDNIPIDLSDSGVKRKQSLRQGMIAAKTEFFN